MIYKPHTIYIYCPFFCANSIIVGAPFGQANNNSIQTGLVYECPVVPGDCRLLVGNDDELTQSMLRSEYRANIILCL